jgi:hypothetical protein
LEDFCASELTRMLSFENVWSALDMILLQQRGNFGIAPCSKA